MLDVRSLKAFFTLGNVKRDVSAFLKGFEAVRLNFRKVCKQVVATVRRSDETEALGVVKPFNCASCHCVDPLR